MNAAWLLPDVLLYLNEHSKRLQCVWCQRESVCFIDTYVSSYRSEIFLLFLFLFAAKLLCERSVLFCSCLFDSLRYPPFSPFVRPSLVMR